MKHSLFVAALALAVAAGPALAIDVTPGAFADADATIGVAMTDTNDYIVKPGCDCEAVPNSGFVMLTTETGRVSRIAYDKIEGQTVTTTDGTVLGPVISVQNEAGSGAILLLVRVDGGVLGAVDRINLRRNSVVWTGTAPKVNTTIDDLKTSIQAAIGAPA